MSSLMQIGPAQTFDLAPVAEAVERAKPLVLKRSKRTSPVASERWAMSGMNALGPYPFL